jgi:hypothetical protein
VGKEGRRRSARVPLAAELHGAHGGGGGGGGVFFDSRLVVVVEFWGWVYIRTERNGTERVSLFSGPFCCVLLQFRPSLLFEYSSISTSYVKKQQT